MDDTSAEANAVDAAEPQEHGSRLARNALGLAGNIGIALGSSASTASVALTLAAIVAASSFASPIAILICGLPMLAIAAAFRRLNRWRVNCGATYAWGGRAISPYFGFIVGWITILAYVVGVVSISLPIGPYVVSLFGNSSSRPGEAIVGFVAVVLATAIAYLGIRLTAWTQWVLIAIEYTGVGILAIWCLVAVFSHNPHSVPFSWSWFSWSSMGGISGFISASLIAVYMFSGWDTGILVNEETSDAREKPGQSVVASVIVLALMYAFLTFALQGAVHTKDLEANGDNALSYIAQVISGSALAKYMILAVALSALGSTLASLVSGVRVTFAMGSDGVLPRQFGKTDPRFRTPVLATVIIGVIASIGVWLYTFGSASVQDSFTTVVSVDGLLFALYYALTAIATAVYYRKLAVTGPWNLIQLAVFPLAAAGFLAYIVVRSVEGLGGWSGKISSRCTSCWESARRSCSTCGSRADRTTSACRERPTSPPPNQPWPPATQRRPDLTGHAQKHLSGYRHPCLNRPTASFVDRGPQCGYCRHRVIARHRNQPMVAPVRSAERRVGAAAGHLGFRP